MKRFDDKKYFKYLGTTVFGRNLIHLETTISTNDYASGLIGNMEAGKTGEINGTLILSNEQTCGRGRFNRKWLSPRGGLWFSLIFNTELPDNKIPSLTIIAAFSAANIIIRDYDIDISIKWPNDLYSNEFKLGGILSEKKELKSHKYIILGMGLNIDIEKRYLESLDNKVANIQDLTQKKVISEKLLAEILGKFEELYLFFSDTGDFNSIFKEIQKILQY